MVRINALGFDWDKGNRKKCLKHALDLLEIEAFFKQEGLYITPDFMHSQKETRYLAVGRSPKGPPMFAVFTLRKKDEELLIRPISARYMHKKEAQKYDKENFKT